MPRKNTRASKWLEQYTKEYKRISQAIRRQEKLGYTIPDDIRPVKPSEMHNIRKIDVQRLMRLTPQKIRKSSWYTDPQGYGETIYGLDVKSHRKAKPSKTKTPSSKTKKKSKPKKPIPTPQESEELDTFWYDDDIGLVPEPQRQYYPG